MHDDFSVDVSGTGFAILPTQIITVYHNIVDYDDKGSVTKAYVNCSAGTSVTKVGSSLGLSSPVPLLLEAFDEDKDWAICIRTDNKAFSSFLEVCDESELPFYVRVIHFLIKILKKTPLL